jgi:hypothetical protein
MPDVTGMQNEFVGKTYRRLRVLAVVQVNQKALRLHCQCTCGAYVLAKAHQLRSGEKVSCGCWKREVLGENTRTHGRANSRVRGYADRTYGIWQAMRDRCSNPNRRDYHRYGGRGITVCEQWRVSFEAFLRDMGPAPAGMTLERVDNERGYSPENCRWATRLEQSRNSVNAVRVLLEGESVCLSEALNRLDLSASTYYSRRKKGFSVYKSLGMPAPN